jgi:hypothetical protein
VAPGEGERRAGVWEHDADPGPDAAAPVEIHLATVAFPPEELGAERAGIGDGMPAARGVPEEIFERRLLR